MHSVSYQQAITFAAHYFIYDIYGFPICRLVKRLSLSMVFQKKTGTLAHMTQGANWLCTVEKIFQSRISTFSKDHEFPKSQEVSWEVSRHQREAGEKPQKICLSRRFLATAIEKHGR